MTERAKKAEKREPWLTFNCPSCGGDSDQMRRRNDGEWERKCPCGARLLVQHVEYLVTTEIER